MRVRVRACVCVYQVLAPLIALALPRRMLFLRLSLTVC